MTPATLTPVTHLSWAEMGRFQAVLCTWLIALLALSPQFLWADIATDFAAITTGAQGQSVAAPGTPGSVASFGRAAFPVLLGTASPVQATVAAGRYGDDDGASAARAVACSHTGFFDTVAGPRSTLFSNAVFWASRQSAMSGTRVAIANSAVAASFFTGQGYTTVAVGTNLTAANLSTAHVLVMNCHASFTAAAITNIRNFAAAGGGIVICATPWALSTQQFADANAILDPFGLVFSGSTPDDSSYTVTAAAPPALHSALPAADALIADKEGTSVMTSANRTIAANAIFQVVNVRMDIPTLAAKLEVLGDNAHYGLIAPTAAVPLITAQKPVEKMLARYQSQKFDILTPAQLFVHPAAADFPGVPKAGTATVARTFTVNGNTATDFYMNQGSKPTRVETGLYAAPGATLTLTIPADKIAQGLQVHIAGNGSEDTTFNYGTWTFFPKLWRRVALTQSVTQTGHVFGGLVTLLVPAGKTLGTFDVTISGAMEAPAFVLGSTTDAQWNAGIKARPVPYGYIQNSKLTIYLPASQLAALENPTAVTSYWKQVMDIADEYYGYAAYRKRGEVVATARYVAAGAAYAGYPIEAGWGASSESLLNSAMTNGDWGTYHELGHGYQDDFDSAFVIALSAEVDVNLLPGMVYTLLHDRTAWDGAHSTYNASTRLPARTTYLALTDAEQTWQKAHDVSPVAYDFYFNLSEAFGWQVYKTALGRLMRYLQSPTSATDAALHALSSSDPNFKRNRFYLLLCDAAGRNLDAYFQRYGLGAVGRGDEITLSVKSQIAAKNYPVWTDNTAIDSLSTPPALSVPEDAAPGTEVYPFVATDAEEPGTIWDYQITGGNTGNAFSIDRRTGSLRVQRVDAETLASYSLTVQVQDNGVPRFSASRTFTVNVADVGEPPQVEGRLLAATSTLANGAVLGNMSVTLEQGRTLSRLEIVAGNDGHFAIHPTSGAISITGASTLPSPGVVVLTVRAVDSTGAVGFGQATVLCNRTAGVLEERWSGTTMTGNPAVTSTFTSFTSGQNVADNYTRRVSGWLVPSRTGLYTFWIASDDGSTLYLSPDEEALHKEAIASVAGYTSFQVWTSVASQRSTSRFLRAGHAYYVEVEHREGGGADHVAVAWEGPGIPQQVIPGTVLIPRHATSSFPVAASGVPAVSITSPAASSVAVPSGAGLLLGAQVSLDIPGTLAVSWSQVSGPGTVSIADAMASSTAVTFPQSGTYVLRLTASDGVSQASDEVTVGVGQGSGGSGNYGAAVAAGADRSLTSLQAILAGAVSDDGLPNPPAAVSSSWSKLSGPGPVSFADASSPSTSVTLSHPGTYLLRLQAYDGEVRTFDDITLTTPGPMALWRSGAFGSVAADEAVAGDLADPNGNGVVNLVEYAFGSDPIASSVPDPMEVDVMAGRLVLSFPRNSAATDVVLVVQASDDLTGNWIDLARSEAGGAFAPLVEGVAVNETPGLGAIRSVSVGDAVLVSDPQHQRRFMRLRVVVP